MLDKTLSKVYTIKGNLPVYKELVKGDVGFENPDDYNGWFQDQYGIKIFRRYSIDSDSVEDVYFVVEPETRGSKKNIDTKNCIKVNDLEGNVRHIVKSIIKDYNKSHSMPWINCNGFNNFISWTEEVLHNIGVDYIKEIKQIKNAYVSTVFQIKTDKEDFYLKIVGSRYIKEIEILEDLLKNNFIPTVDVISINNNKMAYIMKDMGGKNLEEDFNIDYLYDTIHKVAKFQKSVINKRDRKEIKNIYYDMTTPTIIKIIRKIPYLANVLLKESNYRLKEDEKGKLQRSLNEYENICKEIPDIIPYSIDHGDLRPGNIRVNTDRGQIIYDWAWSNYTHPFFTVIGFFHTIRKNEVFKKEKYKLLDVYFNYWVEYASKDRLKDIYFKLEKLTRIYHVVADIYWLQSLTEDYPDNEYSKFSTDGLVIDKRQQYFSHVLRKLIIEK